MAKVTLAEVCDAIEDTLDAATTLVASQSYDGLTEDVHDYPLLQVYPQRGECMPGQQVERQTFQAGIRVTDYVIHADYYAKPVSHAAEAMEAVVDGVDAIETILEAQNTKPYFGMVGIQAYRWEWSRVVFVTAAAGHLYAGAQFIITVRLF